MLCTTCNCNILNLLLEPTHWVLGSKFYMFMSTTMYTVHMHASKHSWHTHSFTHTHTHTRARVRVHVNAHRKSYMQNENACTLSLLRPPTPSSLSLSYTHTHTLLRTTWLLQNKVINLLYTFVTHANLYMIVRGGFNFRRKGEGDIGGWMPTIAVTSAVVGNLVGTALVEIHPTACQHTAWRTQ